MDVEVTTIPAEGDELTHVAVKVTSGANRLTAHLSALSTLSPEDAVEMAMELLHAIELMAVPRRGILGTWGDPNYSREMETGRWRNG